MLSVYKINLKYYICKIYSSTNCEMLYTEIVFSFTPYESIYPELLSASLAEVGFDSFTTSDETLYAYCPHDLYSEQNIKSCISSFLIPGISIDFKTNIIEDCNWNEFWEKNEYEPIVIGDLCVIRASYHSVHFDTRYEIIIDPRMSFGSGAHETTSMLTEFILNSDLHGKNALDMGCGTGILGIAMAISGAEKVYAIDLDKNSVINAKENTQLNGIDNIEIIHGDASSIENTGVKFNLIVANIHKNIIINDLHLYVKALMPGGTILLSGFYVDDISDICKSAYEEGLQLENKYSKNNWAVVSFRLLD